MCDMGGGWWVSPSEPTTPQATALACGSPTPPVPWGHCSCTDRNTHVFLPNPALTFPPGSRFPESQPGTVLVALDTAMGHSVKVQHLRSRTK